LSTLRSQAGGPKPGFSPASGPVSGSRRFNVRGRPPLIVILPSLLVSLILLAPLVYLVIRASDAGVDAFEMLTRARTLHIFKNTVLLAAAVVATSIIIAVPLAWLTSRTDLPGRTFWASAAVLPLVVPSYVGAMTIVAAIGPRGLLQEILSGPFGVERLRRSMVFSALGLPFLSSRFPMSFSM